MALHVQLLSEMLTPHMGKVSSPGCFTSDSRSLLLRLGGKNRHVPDDWAPVTQVEDLHATPGSWLLSLAWPSPSHCSYLGSEWSSGMISPSLCNFTFQVNWVYYTCTYTKKALVVDHHYSWILSYQHTCVLEHVCNAKINTWAQLFFCFCQL